MLITNEDLLRYLLRSDTISGLFTYGAHRSPVIHVSTFAHKSLKGVCKLVVYYHICRQKLYWPYRYDRIGFSLDTEDIIYVL